MSEALDLKVWEVVSIVDGIVETAVSKWVKEWVDMVLFRRVGIIGRRGRRERVWNVVRRDIVTVERYYGDEMGRRKERERSDLCIHLLWEALFGRSPRENGQWNAAYGMWSVPSVAVIATGLPHSQTP